MADIRETAILIDHDLQEVRVDTNHRGMAGRLTRMGFREVTRSDSDPYRRFTGQTKQVGLRRVRIPSQNPRVFRGTFLKKGRAAPAGPNVSLAATEKKSGKNPT